MTDTPNTPPRSTGDAPCSTCGREASYRYCSNPFHLTTAAPPRDASGTVLRRLARELCHCYDCAHFTTVEHPFGTLVDYDEASAALAAKDAEIARLRQCAVDQANRISRDLDDKIRVGNLFAVKLAAQAERIGELEATLAILDSVGTFLVRHRAAEDGKKKEPR